MRSEEKKQLILRTILNSPAKGSMMEKQTLEALQGLLDFKVSRHFNKHVLKNNKSYRKCVSEADLHESFLFQAWKQKVRHLVAVIFFNFF